MQLGHGPVGTLTSVVLWLRRTISTLGIVPSTTCTIVQVTLQFLVSGLIIDVWNTGYLHTLVLLVRVLERILVKVDWRWSETLRRRLLIRNARARAG